MNGTLACAVTWLTLAAASVTGRVWAADPSPPGRSEPVTVARAPTPLPVRPDKPLSLQPSSAPSCGWALAVVVGASAAALWLWKKRPSERLDARSPQLAIVRRTGVGMRSELLLIDVDGQRLLLGVTAQSIQTLYVLPDTPVDEAVDGDVEGQARGLLGREEPQ